MAPRVNPNARAMAKMKQAQVPLNTTDPTVDPEMQSTLRGEQSRVASRKATFAPLANVSGPKSGWGQLMGMFGGKAKKK